MSRKNLVTCSVTTNDSFGTRISDVLYETQLKCRQSYRIATGGLLSSKLRRERRMTYGFAVLSSFHYWSTNTMQQPCHILADVRNLSRPLLQKIPDFRI